MFAMLKDIPSGRVEEEIAFLLEEVQLSPVSQWQWQWQWEWQGEWQGLGCWIMLAETISCKHPYEKEQIGA